MGHTLSDFVDLTDEQHAVLQAFECDDALCKTFYLTGGTLLKALGIVPRMSNDLDFFSFPNIDERTFVVRQKQFFDLLKSILGEKEIDITHHGFIHLPSGMVFDIVSDAIPSIDDYETYGNMRVAGFKDLAASKASALCCRDEIKDYIDIAFLTKAYGLQLSDLEAFAEKKYKLGTVTEEKLLTELIGKRSQFAIPDKIFLREPEKNRAILEKQIDILIDHSSL